MNRAVWSAVGGVWLALSLGCASATRLSLRPEEARHHFTVRHAQPAARAFSSVELALAETYRDLPSVLKLKQPETGTFLLRALVGYRVAGATLYSGYTLKIVATKGTVTLDFELGPLDGSNSIYPPASEIPRIHAAFRAITERLAQAVGGSVL